MPINVLLQIILLGLIPFTVYGQEGMVRYSHTYKVLYGKDGASAVMEIVAQQSGEELPNNPVHDTVSRTMAFNSTSSVMYPSNLNSFEIGGRPNWEYIDTIFVDTKQRSYLQWVDFNTDAYLVKGQLPQIPWRLTNEKRTLLGYRVIKATGLVDSNIIEAWFTPDIPVPVGPGIYSGLPGLILMVTDDAKGEAYIADLIDLNSSLEISKPLSGRNVSIDEYDRIKASKLARGRRIYEQLLRERQRNGFNDP